MPDLGQHLRVTCNSLHDVGHSFVGFIIGVIEARGLWTGGDLEIQIREISVVDARPAILAIPNDTNQAVRMKSLEILAGDKDDPEVQSALLAVLRGDGSVRMRLRALDLLAASDLGRDRLGQAVQDLDLREDQALLVRAAAYATPEPGPAIREGL